MNIKYILLWIFITLPFLFLKKNIFILWCISKMYASLLLSTSIKYLQNKIGSIQMSKCHETNFVRNYEAEFKMLFVL